MARWPFNSKEWLRVREEVLMRDGNQCQIGLRSICTGYATQADHYPIPLARLIDEFGKDTYEALQVATDPNNLRAACGPCNARLGLQYGRVRARQGYGRGTPPPALAGVGANGAGGGTPGGDTQGVVRGWAGYQSTPPSTCKFHNPPTSSCPHSRDWDGYWS